MADICYILCYEYMAFTQHIELQNRAFEKFFVNYSATLALEYNDSKWTE